MVVIRGAGHSTRMLQRGRKKCPKHCLKKDFSRTLNRLIRSAESPLERCREKAVRTVPVWPKSKPLTLDLNPLPGEQLAARQGLEFRVRRREGVGNRLVFLAHQTARRIDQPPTGLH